jgi:hypothetical protein
MAFRINNTSYGIDLNGNTICKDLVVDGIVNDDQNNVSFFTARGGIGGIFFGQKQISTSNRTLDIISIDFLKIEITGSLQVYGGCYCEFIVSGTHNNLSGFYDNYEFMLSTSDGLNNSIYQNNSTIIASGSNITPTTRSRSFGALVQPALKQTSSGHTTTFSIIPHNFLDPGNNVNHGEYNIFFRIMNGGGAPGTIPFTSDIIEYHHV